jgi:uncharacterized membrane protein
MTESEKVTVLAYISISIGQSRRAEIEDEMAALVISACLVVGYVPSSAFRPAGLRPAVRLPALAATTLPPRARVIGADARPAVLVEGTMTRPRAPAVALAAVVARLAVGAALFSGSPAFAAGATASGKLHIGQKLALWLQATGLPNEAVLVLISMLPVVELRGAVPVGSWLGVPPLRTFVVCVAGNSLAVFLLLAALRLPLVESLLSKILEKARSKMGTLASSDSLPLGLAVFVGVPLPGTGGWTGAMIAHLLGMPFGIAFGSIFLGVLMAGVIMTALTLAGWYGAAFAATALALFCVGALLKQGNAE